MAEGVVTRVLAGFFDVTDGNDTYRCRARGVFRKRKTTVLVGDRVVYQDTGRSEGWIEEVLPRQTELVRPPIANVSQAVLVFSAVNPEFQSYLLDKALVVVSHAGLEELIVITKVDLVSSAVLADLISPYVAAGYRIIPISTKDQTGVTDVRSALKGHTSVFVGPSGVGKSSLGNALSPELGLKMGEISEKMGRGKHTTRHTELFMIDRDTYVADAAGFSQLQVDVPSVDLRLYFPEFFLFAKDCPYRGCLHFDEEECAVKQAVQMNQIASSRYESYCQLYDEVHHREETKY
jgi:ribosome biogenesis GTPase / thiamine phosphate phosphatase